jgi:transcriptional regulator with XRE-family HTH domain
MSTAVSVAMDFARLSGGWAGPLVFNLWLRRQLRERRMSQRHLALLSGVNHSTISRLIAGSRTPNLQTAAKLVHALRLEWTEEQVATYFDLLPERTLFPTQRVESALRGDGDLDDSAVREVMAHYLSVRQRRRVSARAPGDGPAEAGSPRISASGPDAVP